MRDAGPRDAPAVILLHGFGASLDTWDARTASVERGPRGHRVVRFDLPGSGLSAPDLASDTDVRSVALQSSRRQHR